MEKALKMVWMAESTLLDFSEAANPLKLSGFVTSTKGDFSVIIPLILLSLLLILWLELLYYTVLENLRDFAPNSVIWSGFETYI